jgi:deazaflavin-dependent oxidoreductase (nitroreductase family)
MPDDSEYEPSPTAIVREQVADYEASGGKEANTLLDTGYPIVVVTTIGRRSGKIRKFAVMRVEHDGEYALVASKAYQRPDGRWAGGPTHPLWYYNLLASPDSTMVQDGPAPVEMTIREVDGEERSLWWNRAVEEYPPYAEYQENGERKIPILVASARARRPSASRSA